ncbi:MAG: hypothetical protein GF416_05815 [Candidatus Altiarchaeales archaeon]|nr:hypothetical protein [Candidatus Altiarchaeales archaeon]MBD3416632.1 hypothetical protein [Candidatus Altiarchaeales archaeon]
MLLTLDYKSRPRLQARHIETLKLTKTIEDESGDRPIMISVVIPTFNKKDPKYNRALYRVLSECCQLVDKGVIDEIVIAEGSRLEDGKPDYEFMEYILAVAMKHCQTFKNEVMFVQNMPEGRQKAMQGRYDFCVRLLSQVDPKMHKVFLDHSILTKDELEFLKGGKGANLWFSIPVTYGDIICFVDSDIVSFNDNYVKGLIMPIMERWGEKNDRGFSSGVVFNKATYKRRHKIRRGFKLGGRLSRLAAKPLFMVLAERGIFKGLDGLTYHFSGECAFTRDLVNMIQFSNGYDIETSVLCQLWKNAGVDMMSQTDLGYFRHLPGPEEHATNMLGEIMKALHYWIRRYGFEDSIGDIDQLVRDYEETAEGLLPEYKKMAAKSSGKIKYREEEIMEDRARIQKYKNIIREGFQAPESYEPKLLKPWESIKDQMNQKRGYSYVSLKSTLQQRVNMFTSETILTKIRVQIDRTSEIIEGYCDYIFY